MNETLGLLNHRFKCAVGELVNVKATTAAADVVAGDLVTVAVNNVHAAKVVLSAVAV